MTEPIKIVFLATPEFATPFLEKLASDHRFQLLAAITQEDKPVGRKKILTPPPVKQTSQSLGIQVFQPAKLNKDQALLEELENLAPDFLIVVAYGQILSKRVLQIAKIKPINVHGSILPKYRGASPIEQALLNGDQKTGLSIMEMAPSMDTGAVYQVIESAIEPEDNHLSLRTKLSQLGANELPDILVKIKSGELTAKPQNEADATYCQKIERQDGLIDPIQLTASQIYNRYRAYCGWPGIFLPFQNKTLKLLVIHPAKNESVPSGAFQVEGQKLFLGCSEGTLEITELQMEGKTAQTTSSFLAGNRQLFS